MKAITRKDSVVKRVYRSARSLVIDPAQPQIDQARKRRLLVAKAQWRDNADSPVCLMIDDFANAWHDTNKNEVMDIGEDWGAGLDKATSAFDFLNRNILIPFPEACVTLFTVMGPINSFDRASPFTFAQRIDATPQSTAFFTKIHRHKHYEIAFHGYDHGTAGNENTPHVQEWANISSVDQSFEKIRRGTQIYEQVFGEKPRGGKTGAYYMNRYIEESLSDYGFFWWCRDWTPKNLTKRGSSLLCAPKMFGAHGVIDLPSTINGRVWYRRQVENLLQDRQIISIQEHISPSGAGTRHIRPNIIEDYRSLQKIYKFLRTKNVWHATMGEIAEYIDAYYYTQIHDATKDSFKLRYTGNLDTPILTLLIDPFCLYQDNGTPRHGFLRISLPDGSILAGQQYRYDKELDYYLVTLPVQNGTYQVEWQHDPVPELLASADQQGNLKYSQHGLTGAFATAPPFATANILKYQNNHTERLVQYIDDRSISLFCTNSSPEDRLIT